MTDTLDAAVAEAQRLAAQLHATGAPIAMRGEPHSPQRIMFWHGGTTGHAACSCPVVDEHGHNVNPGRKPLDGRQLGRSEGSRKAGETYARRRARKAADELALIDPALWDDKTRQIVATLATMAAPSRIDDVLAEHLPPVALCNCDDGRTHPIGEPPCVLAEWPDDVPDPLRPLERFTVTTTGPTKRCMCTNLAGPCPVHDAPFPGAPATGDADA